MRCFGSKQFLTCLFFFFQAEDGIRDLTVTGVQTCALPIWSPDQRRVIEPRIGRMRAGGTDPAPGEVGERLIGPRAVLIRHQEAPGTVAQFLLQIGEWERRDQLSPFARGAYSGFGQNQVVPDAVFRAP